MHPGNEKWGLRAHRRRKHSEVTVDMNTLIIGNGFDLGLGWKTKYVDFYKSSFFPRGSVMRSSRMGQFLDKEAAKDTWGGIEESLERYASLPENEHTFDEDKVYYDTLRLLFLFYINEATGHGTNGYVIPLEETCNEYFIKECIGYDNAIDNVISFNYTSFSQIAKCLTHDTEDLNGKMEDILDNIRMTYVHRREDGDLVLGISNDAKLTDTRYDFLKKSHQKLPPSFYRTLLASDRLIFWGLSLSKSDQPYFKAFLEQLASSDNEMSRTLFIVNKDIKSCDDCISRIEKLLGGDITTLAMKHDIIKVCTDKSNYSEGFAKLLLTLRMSKD